jgi:hypothetical protein
MTDIATLVVALLVALIAWREWIVNRTRLRVELFDRRYKVYERLTGFLADVLINGRVAPNSDIELLRDTKQAHFLFGGDPVVKDVITSIYKKAVALHALEAELPALSGQERTDNLEAQREIKEYFSQQLNLMELTFEQYLGISE